VVWGQATERSQGRPEMTVNYLDVGPAWPNLSPDPVTSKYPRMAGSGVKDFP